MNSTLAMNVLPPWVPRSVFGAVLAALYIVFATGIILSDRKGGGGNWISLSGLASFLITFPVSALGELLNMKLDFRRNIDMGFAVLVCALMVYLAGAGLGWLAKVIFSPGPRG